LVAAGHEIAIYQRAERRAQAARQTQILDRHRHAVQRADLAAAREPAIGCGGFRAQFATRTQRDDRVDLTIQLLDLRQVRVEYLEGRQLAAREQRGKPPRVEKHDLGRRRGAHAALIRWLGAAPASRAPGRSPTAWPGASRAKCPRRCSKRW